MQNLVKLIDVITAFEEWTTAKELGKNTTNRPDIDWYWGLEVA